MTISQPSTAPYFDPTSIMPVRLQTLASCHSSGFSTNRVIFIAQQVCFDRYLWATQYSGRFSMGRLKVARVSQPSKAQGFPLKSTMPTILRTHTHE